MKTSSYVYGVEKLDGNDAWALFEASAAGDLPRVKALLAKDRRLANAQYWYQFPIHMAVRAGHTAVVKELLDHGADPGQSRFTYNSWDKLLACAAERGFGPIESLLQRAMRRRFRYSPEFAALRDAIIARDARKVGAVVRREPELVQASDALGNNALHWSIITRQLRLIERFVELGTPLDAQRADGNTPVLLAAGGAYDYWHRSERDKSHPSLRNAAVMVGSLLALGAEYTISVAASVGDLERVAQLLSKDATLATRLDSAQVSPLARAAGEGHLHIVKLLLEHGADPNLPESGAPEGLALFEACSGNHLEVVQLLLDRGANPNAGADSSGCCLTICEVRHGERASPVQKLLRKRGAQSPPYAMSSQQIKQAVRKRSSVVDHEEFSTCLMAVHDEAPLLRYLDDAPERLAQLDVGSIAEFPAAESLLRKLLERGLEVNQTDWLGKTPLHVVAALGESTLAAVLLDAGAEINAREAEYQGTPLAAAVRASGIGDPQQAKRQRKMVQFLLQNGADANLSHDQPWATPLAWALRQDQPEIAELLKQSGAK